MPLPLLIFLAVTLTVTIGLIYLTFKNVKSGGLKILLTLVILFASITVSVIGFGVWGAALLGREVAENVKEEQENAKIRSEELKPVLAGTKEQKEVFEIGEKIAGNNIDFEVIKVEKSTAGVFGPSDEYCKMYFRVTNRWSDNLSLSSFDFQIRDNQNQQVYERYGTPEDPNLLSTNIQILPGQTVEKYLPFECKPELTPYSLSVDLGISKVALQDLLVYGEDAKIQPIKVNLK